MKRSAYSLRRLLALVTALLMFAALFAGCGNNNSNVSVSTEPSGTTGQTDAPTDAPTTPATEPTEAPTEPEATAPPTIVGFVNAGPLNVRSEPSTIGTDILRRLETNTRVEVLEQKIIDGTKWGRLVDGWVIMNYVTIVDDPADLPSGSTSVENDNNIDDGTNKDAGKDKESDKGSTSAGTNNAGTNNTVVSDGNKVALGRGTVINTSSLAIRTGPGANYEWVSYISLGESADYFQKNGNWVRLKKGWVNSKYLELEYAVKSGTEGTINTGLLNVREDADSEAKSITTVKKGDKVTILEVKGIWGKVEYEAGKFGWINLDYVKLSTAPSAYTTGEATVTAAYLHYRKEANADSTALGTYKKGDKVTITEVSGNWGKTNKGWINMKYVEMAVAYTTGSGTVTASSLNVRDAASTSGKDLGSLSKGDKVTILEVKDGWGKIAYDSSYGWISMKYVEMGPAAKYSVTIGAVTGGTVKATSASYAQGATVALTVTPESGKVLDVLTVKDASGNEVTVKDNKFTMPASNVTVTATFNTPAAKYTVTLNAGTGGKLTASTNSCTAGTVVTLTATPDSGFVLDGVLSGMNTTLNQSIDVSSGTFTMPEGNVNIVATFKKADAAYKVTVNSVTNGKVTANTTVAEANATITLTIAPDDGYELESLSIKDSANLPVSVSETGNTRTFTMPASNVTVAASFKIVKYAVEVKPSSNGSVSVNPDKYEEGQTVTLVVTPEPGFELDALKVNGKAITGTSFKMPASKAIVETTFKKIPLNVEIKSADHGTMKASVNSADASTAKVGETVTLTATPESGYVLDSVTIMDEKNNTITADGTGNNRTFTMPGYAVTVAPAFKAITKYTVSFDSMTNGSVSADKTSVAEGETVTLTIAPASDYELDTLTYTPEGGSATAITGSSFTMPAKNVTVKATFKAVVSRTITVKAVDKDGKAVEGVSVKLQVRPNASGTYSDLAAGSKTTNANGIVKFTTSELKDIPKGAGILAEVGGGYGWAWTGEVGKNTVRTATPGEGMSVRNEPASVPQGYLDVTAESTESFSGTFTVTVVKVAE